MASGSTEPGCSSRNKWAPLQYPSSAIFAPAAARRGPNGIGARTSDPFFPLHRTVLLAAMRELLIIDGKIDPSTMEIVAASGSGNSTEGAHDMIPTVDQKADATTDHELQKKRKNSTAALTSDDDEPLKDFSSFKKQRKQDASVDSLAALQQQATKDSSLAPQPHVVPIAADVGDGRGVLDCNYFDSAEAMVNYAVERAVLGRRDSTDDVVGGEAPITSQRKVSDADLSEEKDGNFSSTIVRLARSNIMTLSGSKLSKLGAVPCVGFDWANPNSTIVTDDAIVSFLRNPKLQREQQQGNANQPLLVMPRLLEVSIEDEYNLRARASATVSSMIKLVPCNVALRTFLGYKSAKSPDNDRILGILTDVLFDVSHAMYAWLQTEGDLARQQGAAVKCNRDAQIKASLFDSRALNRIGGLEPSSLLPLALGHPSLPPCRTALDRVRTFTGRQDGNGNSYHQSTLGAIAEKDALLELGRKRRGTPWQIDDASSAPLIYAHTLAR
ncbi:hypothetical protein ACHAXT_006432 [Thalassiosira profunda]